MKYIGSVWITMITLTMLWGCAKGSAGAKDAGDSDSSAAGVDGDADGDADGDTDLWRGARASRLARHGARMGPFPHRK
jgi:hypothetical protein